MLIILRARVTYDTSGTWRLFDASGPGKMSSYLISARSSSVKAPSVCRICRTRNVPSIQHKADI